MTTMVNGNILWKISCLGSCEKLSKPQLNYNSTQPNITLSWVGHENGFTNHPTPNPPPPQKLNASNTATDLILVKL